MAGDHRRIVDAVTIISATEAGIASIVTTVRTSPAIIKGKESVAARKWAPGPNPHSAEARIRKTPTRGEVSINHARRQSLIRAGQCLSSGLAPIIEFVFVVACQS